MEREQLGSIMTANGHIEILNIKFKFFKFGQMGSN